MCVCYIVYMRRRSRSVPTGSVYVGVKILAAFTRAALGVLGPVGYPSSGAIARLNDYVHCYIAQRENSVFVLRNS